MTYKLIMLMIGVLIGFYPNAPFKLVHFIQARARKAQATASNAVADPQHPYREAAVIESYEPDPYPVRFDRPIKKKREPIVLPKSMAVFLLLVPAMLTDIGLGFAYDTSAIGTGAKWGMFAAGVLTNIFFIVCAIAHAEKKS